jgi:hypothetical protein
MSKLQRLSQTNLTLVCCECKEEFKGQTEADKHTIATAAGHATGHSVFIPKQAEALSPKK